MRWSAYLFSHWAATSTISSRLGSHPAIVSYRIVSYRRVLPIMVCANRVDTRYCTYSYLHRAKLLTGLLSLVPFISWRSVVAWPFANARSRQWLIGRAAPPHHSWRSCSGSCNGRTSSCAWSAACRLSCRHVARPSLQLASSTARPPAVPPAWALSEPRLHWASRQADGLQDPSLGRSCARLWAHWCLACFGPAEGAVIRYVARARTRSYLCAAGSVPIRRGGGEKAVLDRGAGG